MSQPTGSAGMTQFVQPRDETPKPVPTKRRNHLQNTQGNTPAKRSEPIQRRTTKVKEDFRVNLPEWLRKDEPKTRLSPYWLNWYLYAKSGGANRTRSAVPHFVDYYTEAMRNAAAIHELREQPIKTAIISNEGGMGKTTTAALLAVMLDHATDMDVVLYDGDTSGPNMLQWFNLEQRETLTGADIAYWLMRGARPVHNDFVGRVAAVPNTGISIIHATNKVRLNRETSRSLVRAISPNYTYFIADTVPGIVNIVDDVDTADTTASTAQTGDGTQGLVETADIVIISADGSSSKGIVAIAETLDHEPYGLRDETGRVAPHVLISVCQVRRRDFNSRTIATFAERYNASPEQIVLIPFSQYIRGSGDYERINPITLSALDPRTRYGASRLARTFMEMATSIRQRRSSHDSTTR